MLIYLGSPYTSPDKAVEQQRYEQICIVAGELILRGYHIFCPIAMAHPIRLAVGIEGKFDFWAEFDEKMLNACAELWIAMLLGWRESYGLKNEIRIMNRLNRPIYCIDPITLEKLTLAQAT